MNIFEHPNIDLIVALEFYNKSSGESFRVRGATKFSGMSLPAYQTTQRGIPEVLTRSTVDQNSYIWEESYQIFITLRESLIAD